MKKYYDTDGPWTKGAFLSAVEIMGDKIEVDIPPPDLVNGWILRSLTNTFVSVLFSMILTSSSDL